MACHQHLLYHIVFSTKRRVGVITPAVEKRVWSALGAASNKHHVTPVQIGGVEDHVHVLVSAPRTKAPSQIVQYVKGSSSRWINASIPELDGFAWQTGYGIFSVSRSVVRTTARYIANQRAHHAHFSFEDEYLKLLQQHSVKIEDSRFLWD